MDIWVQWAGTFGIAFGGVATSFYLLRANRQKLEADSAKVLSEGSIALWKPYKDDLDKARLEIVGLHAELEVQKGLRMDLEHRVAQAEQRVLKLEAWITANTAVEGASINGGH